MSDDVSPGKSEKLRDEDFHYKAISAIENAFSQEGIKLSVAWAQARQELNDIPFRALTARLKCSASTRTKYVRGGEFFLQLSDDQRLLLPDSATTLYAIASAPSELREKAFADGIISKQLTRGGWNEWLRANRVKREIPRTLLQIYQPHDQSRQEALVEAITQLAAENSAKIKVTGVKKKKASVREQIRAIAASKPNMSVAELAHVLGIKDAA